MWASVKSGGRRRSCVRQRWNDDRGPTLSMALSGKLLALTIAYIGAISVELDGNRPQTVASLNYIVLVAGDWTACRRDRRIDRAGCLQTGRCRSDWRLLYQTQAEATATATKRARLMQLFDIWFASAN